MMDALGVELLFQWADRVLLGGRRSGFWLKQMFDLRDEILALRFELRDLRAKPQGKLWILCANELPLGLCQLLIHTGEGLKEWTGRVILREGLWQIRSPSRERCCAIIDENRNGEHAFVHGGDSNMNLPRVQASVGFQLR